MGSRGTAPCILNLGTRWWWVFSITSLPLYPHGKSLWYPLDRGLGMKVVEKRKVSGPAGNGTHALVLIDPL
jgi:hypothetical protein